jgi:hypothetical protein
MNISCRLIAPALVLAALCMPAAASAQAQPEVRYLTVSKFQMPADSMQRRLVMLNIDSVMVPYARMDPNVLSYRVLTHNWGADSDDILIVAEYGSWSAIEAVCDACNTWVTSKTPAAGTQERARWDAMGDAFARAYAGHADEIYASPVRRIK